MGLNLGFQGEKTASSTLSHGTVNQLNNTMKQGPLGEVNRR